MKEMYSVVLIALCLVQVTRASSGHYQTVVRHADNWYATFPWM